MSAPTSAPKKDFIFDLRKKSVLCLQSRHQRRGRIGARLCACRVAFLTAPGTRYADRTDHLAADHDRDAAAQGDGLRRLALAFPGRTGLGRVAPFDRLHLEHVRGEGLALGEPE